ncbi:mannosyltransferase [Mycobacterium bohemicum DSM 44277]|uniref:D-inositol 3-phosphate glycosyltransferase n=1 Tax=Mycobacterium bohemicum DSM 44277 TaxID=1236609 RepID=A0A0U0W939_MYCBE|nr:mannosyltransferase [Mycobacterium bohemicum DSM 44277]
MRHDDVLRRDDPRRVAVLAVHTSPLAQPGTGDAGGMNVYVLQTALHLARRGVEVEIFTRATASTAPPVERVAPGVLVRNVVAGPFEGLDKYDLPTQLCAFAAGVLRAEASHEPGYYDIVHSHYWLSGQVGWLARDRWAVPLVHTAHTLAAVKNAALADGDAPEPPLRTVGEQQVVDEADRLIVNTEDEAKQLITIHRADPARIDVVHPGVDLQVFRPGDRRAARAALDRLLRLGAPQAEAMRHAAAAHAATFSWDNTTDALLASYRRAIGDFPAERQRRVRHRAAMRRPRHWAPRRGVGA